MSTVKHCCFLAGWLYCVVIVCGLTSELGFRGSLLNFDNVFTTARNISNHPERLRWALILDMIMSCADVVISILVGFILFRAGASPIWSFTAVAFRFLQQAVLATNLLHMFAASLLLDDTLPIASVVETAFVGSSNASPTTATTTLTSKESLAFLFLLLHKYGYLLALIFFGLSMLLTGIVVWVWGVFPNWLGGLLTLAGLGYITDSTLFFLWNGYNGEATAILMLPAFISEFSFTACLLLQLVNRSNKPTA